MIVVGNFIALVASILMVSIGLIIDKKKILFVQSIQIFLYIISNFILGGITGALVNIVGFIKNIYCYYDKLKLKEKIIFSLLIVIFSILFNNLGLIGFLPVFATVLYIWFMDTSSVIKLKILIMITAFCWFIYDIVIKSYTSSVFDLLTILVNLYGIFLINKKQNNNLLLII